MKRLITCASLAAVGAVGVQAQFLGDASQTKAWSVHTKLRGFYDNNYTTLPAPGKRGSWGSELSLAGGYLLRKENTSGGIRYEYDGKYFADRPRGAIDHSHLADANFHQSFSERFDLDLKDSFVIAQEPFLIEPGPVQTAFLRTEGDNMRNLAGLAANVKLTQKLATRFSYSNTLFDYKQVGDASRSALLDRMENVAGLDLRWQFSETTTGLVGYQFSATDMSSNDLIFNRDTAFATALRQQLAGDAFYNSLTPAQQATYFEGRLNSMPQADKDAIVARIPTSKVRDSISHYAFLGVDESFTDHLQAKARAGVQYTEYTEIAKFRAINPNLVGGDASVVPYADVSLNLSYGTGSVAMMGVKHSRNSTDVAMLQAFGATTLDQESTTLYASISHKITPKVIAILRGQWQSSQFNAGGADKEFDDYFSGDLTLSWELPQVWKFITWYAEAGYAVDRLDSDLQGRSFSRHRGFLGIRATL